MSPFATPPPCFAPHAAHVLRNSRILLYRACNAAFSSPAASRQPPPTKRRNLASPPIRSIVDFPPHLILFAPPVTYLLCASAADKPTPQGFTVDGWLDDEDREESFVDKCIWVEGKDKPKQDSYRGSKVKTSLIGTVVEDMRIQNCGYIELREPPSRANHIILLQY